MYGMVGTRAFGAGHMMGYGAGLFGPFVAFLFTLLFVALVVLVILVAIRKTKGSAPSLAAPAQDSALAIARERLARGEIDAEQYTSIANALGGQQPTVPTPQG